MLGKKTRDWVSEGKGWQFYKPIIFRERPVSFPRSCKIIKNIAKISSTCTYKGPGLLRTWDETAESFW